MARRNIILGNGRGKLGDIVMYRQNGQQISRIRVTPKNPRTAGQSVQRMILASASKTLAALRNLYNHSFEGIAVGQKSTQHAQSLLMNLYRGVAVVGLSGNTPLPDSVQETVFAIKGAPIAGIVAGQPMSRGSLTLGEYDFLSDAANVLHLAISPATATISSQETYAAALAALGLEPGDQLSVIVYSQNATSVVAETETAVNRPDAYRYARITFAAELPEGFTGSLIVDDAFNPALISKSEGTFPAVNTTVIEGANYLTIEVGGLAPLGYSARGAAVVRSQKDAAGKTHYNNANFVVNTNFGIMPEGVYPSYMDGASVINVGDTLYLKNAEVAPFAWGWRGPSKTLTFSPELPWATTTQNAEIGWSDNSAFTFADAANLIVNGYGEPVISEGRVTYSDGSGSLIEFYSDTPNSPRLYKQIDTIVEA